MVNERGGPDTNPKSSHTTIQFVASLDFPPEVCCVERFYHGEVRPSELDNARGEAADRS
jgi:hypothetical protein